MVDEFIIAATKVGYDVKTEADINNYVFHSGYNTFKIIRSKIVSFDLINATGQIFQVPHILPFTPLVTAFAKNGSDSQVFPPNSSNINFRNDTQFALIGPDYVDPFFVSISANDDNIIFAFNSSSETTVHVKYYCLEAI